MNQPPIDYGRLTLSQIREDLVETLSDRTINAGQEELAPILDALEEDVLVRAVENMVDARPSEELAGTAASLLKHDHEAWWSQEAVELARSLVSQLQSAAGISRK